MTRTWVGALPAVPAAPYDVGVAVSYAAAGALRGLSHLASITWLDAVDSWLLVNGSAVRAGRPSYLARAFRDAVRLATAPAADVVTYISRADLQADRGMVRARRRLVLPAVASSTTVLADDEPGRRFVLAADWSYAPNADGLTWFFERVLPQVQLPEGWTVHVFGRGAPSVPGVVVHGHVDDEQDLYRQGDVHIAPVAHGAGVKRKVVSPLLAGLPVVTTPAGAHGLRPNERLGVHGEPEAFAHAMLAGAREAVAVRPVAGADVFDADDRQALLAVLGLTGRTADVGSEGTDDR